MNEQSQLGPTEFTALEPLFERAALSVTELPAMLAKLYGGNLGFRSPVLYANFVASVDGVVTLAGSDESGHLISGDSAADRFVMGLLRAFADAILLGASTFRHAPGDLWHPDHVDPLRAVLYRELRAQLGLRAQPTLVLLTASGVIDAKQPALSDALIVTTPAGEARLRGELPSGARIAVIDASTIRLSEVIALLRREGMRAVLTEGGPSLVAGLVAERLLDELFLTSSPALFGRFRGDARKSLSDGIDHTGTKLELLSVRRAQSHLFLRYGISR